MSNKKTKRDLFFYEFKVVNNADPEKTAINEPLCNIINELKSFDRNNLTVSLNLGDNTRSFLLENLIIIKQEDGFTMISYKIPRLSGNNTMLMNIKTKDERNLQQDEEIVEYLHLVVDEKRRKFLFWAVNPYNNPNFIINPINKSLAQKDHAEGIPVRHKIETKKIVVDEWKNVLEDSSAEFTIKSLVTQESISSNEELHLEQPLFIEERQSKYIVERALKHYEFMKFMEEIDFTNKEFSKMKIDVCGKSGVKTSFEKKYADDSDPISYSHKTCELPFRHPPKEEIHKKLIELLKAYKGD